jgi:hypothetical protein
MLRICSNFSHHLVLPLLPVILLPTQPPTIPTGLTASKKAITDAFEIGQKYSEDRR